MVNTADDSEYWKERIPAEQWGGPVWIFSALEVSWMVENWHADAYINMYLIHVYLIYVQFQHM